MVLGRHCLTTHEPGSLVVKVSELVVQEEWNSNQLSKGCVLSGCAGGWVGRGAERGWGVSQKAVGATLPHPLLLL